MIPKSKIIWSYDGGGVLAIGPAMFMALAEDTGILPNPNILVGTSAGSILAAARAIGMSWNEIMTAFHAKAPQIFKVPGWSWRLDPRKPKYDGKGLAAALRDVFGDIPINKTLYPVFITAMDYTRGRPKIFDSSDSTPLWEAVAASCSAPTYFPPRNGLVDGGLIANSPSVVGIAGAISKLGISLEDIYCVSIGTNGDYWNNPKINENTSKLGWADLILSNPTRCNEELAVFQSQALLQSRYLRIEPITQCNYGLDQLRIMDEYSKIWSGLFVQRQAQLETFIRSVP